MRKTLLLFLFVSVLAAAQEPEQNEIDIILDELFAADSLDVMQFVDEIKKQDYLYASFMYNDKTLFSGRDFGVEQYSFFPSISYIDSNNFFANLSSGYFSSVRPNWDFVTFSAGYSNYIDKKKSFLATGIYSYSSFSQDVADLNNQRLTASISYRKKWFRNSLTAGYLFGGNSSTFISNNTYISLAVFKSKSLNISIQPRLGLFWGTQTITELVSTGIRFRPFELVNKDLFQMLNTELSIPLELDFGNWDLEIEYTFSMPNELPGEEKLENMGYVSISIGYLLGL